MGSSVSPSLVRLNIGGEKFCTTMDTLSRREPDSMLAVMFSGRHALSFDSEGYVFVDRDGKHFRHILNWLRGCVVPSLSNGEYSELKQEAEYYQLLGLIEEIDATVDEKKGSEDLDTDLTRRDIIKSIQNKRVRFRGVNFCGLDLSKLDLYKVDFSYACLENVNFSHADLCGASFVGANLQNANLQDANLAYCSFNGADLRFALLQSADLCHAHLDGANFEGANLRHAKFRKAYLNGAKRELVERQFESRPCLRSEHADRHMIFMH